MIQLLDKINHKVEKNTRKKTSDGYANGRFPSGELLYPCPADASDKYWQKVWHKERAIEYYRQDNFWLSTTEFSTTVLAKQLGKIYFDAEYYSLLTKIFIRNEETTQYKIIQNGDIDIASGIIISGIADINTQLVMRQTDYLTVATENFSGIVQIKYRLIG